MKPEYLSWVLSAWSILTLTLMGNKSKWGPRVGLASQAVWIYYLIQTGQPGLLIGACAFTLVHIRNIIKWEKADEGEEQ